MPYSGANDPSLPSNVAARAPSIRARWVRVWNGTYNSCLAQDGKPDVCETLAFQVANAQLEDDEKHLRHSIVKAAGDLMLIVTSNSYQDREGEWLTTQALSEWVDSQWDGDKYIGKNYLRIDRTRHAGVKMGEIIWSDMFGPFLVEVARKRYSGVPAFQLLINQAWDMVRKEPDGWGASHGFYSRQRTRDSEGIVHHIIDKRETTVLRRMFAANTITSAKVV